MDLSYKDIEELLNKKHKKIRFTPTIIILSILVIGYIHWGKYEYWVTYITAAIIFSLVILSYFNDISRKSTFLDETLNSKFSNIQSAFEGMSKCSKIWTIVESKDINDAKNNAGANQGISRKRIKLKKKNPPNIKSTITPLYIQLNKNDIYLYPRHVLIINGSKIVIKNYLIVTSVFNTIKYVEDETVPKDAEIVDTTWLYINKNGTQDKRYKDNRKLPIVEYAQIEFKSMFSTLGEIQLSRINEAKSFCDIMKVELS